MVHIVPPLVTIKHISIFFLDFYLVKRKYYAHPPEYQSLILFFFFSKLFLNLIPTDLKIPPIILTLFYPSAKSRRGIVMITVTVSVSVSVSVDISHFSHYRSQFKSDPYQTWYDEWLWISDVTYCLVIRSSDHSRSGPLISS